MQSESYKGVSGESRRGTHECVRHILLAAQSRHRVYSRRPPRPERSQPTVAAEIFNGSVGPMPNSFVEIKRVATGVAGTPMAIPAKIMSMLSFRTAPITLKRVAPSAISWGSYWIAIEAGDTDYFALEKLDWVLGVPLPKKP